MRHFSSVPVIVLIQVVSFYLRLRRAEAGTIFPGLPDLAIIHRSSASWRGVKNPRWGLQRCWIWRSCPMAEQEARRAVGGIGKPMLHVLGEVREVRHWPAARCCVLMLLSVLFLVRRWVGEATGWGFNGDLPLVYIQAAWGGETNERGRWRR